MDPRSTQLGLDQHPVRPGPAPVHPSRPGRLMGFESDHHMIFSYSDATPEADKASLGVGWGGRGEDSINESPQFTETQSTSHHLVK